MDAKKQAAIAAIEAKKDVICHVADTIWANPELSLQEVKSAALYCQVLEQEGFQVEKGVCSIPTAFAASFGSGRPHIGILAEYDALSGLSQKAGSLTQEEIVPGGCGHGCGHNLLGAGALAAALGVKAYLETAGVSGTVTLYGCPGEEGGAAKAFMARDGLWRQLDAALTWHPEDTNEVITGSSNSCIQVQYTFHGIASHAAGAPDRGRSALDAVELMNIGVQFLREHMSDKARIHYAITDTGGDAPNVVQSRAQVLYAIRAPKITQVKELYNRVCNIAKGAALMTETTVEIRQVAAYSNLISSKILADHMNTYLEKLGPIPYTEQEYAYAQKFQQSLSDQDKNQLPTIARDYFGPKAPEAMKTPIFEPIACQNLYSDLKYSTDVGDVSWIVPTVHLNIPTFAAGTALHSWQAVAQGKSSIAHKGMLYAAKIMSLTALDFLQNPELANQARKELTETLDGETYPNPLPKDLKPELW